jgi:hypothetical protein
MDEQPKENKHFGPEMMQTYADKEKIQTETKHQQHLESNEFVQIWGFMNDFWAKFFGLWRFPGLAPPPDRVPEMIARPPTPQFFRRSFTLNGSNTDRFVFNKLPELPHVTIAQTDEVHYARIILKLASTRPGAPA